MSTTHTIGIAEMLVVKAPDQIRSVLGSCVGVTLVDRGRKIGGMAHVILPDSSEGSGDPGKFADCAVELLLESMLAAGARRGRICAKMAGGAQMFGSASQNGLGERNIDAVKERLKKHLIPINVGTTYNAHSNHSPSCAKSILSSGGAGWVSISSHLARVFAKDVLIMFAVSHRHERAISSRVKLQLADFRLAGLAALFGRLDPMIDAVSDHMGQWIDEFVHHTLVQLGRLAVKMKLHALMRGPTHVTYGAAKALK